MSDDPISAMIDEAPSRVHFETVADTAYDPNEDSHTPADPVKRPKRFGFLTKVTEEGLAVKATATLYMRLADLKDSDVQSGVTRVLVSGRTYVVMKADTRFWRGEQSGWALHLQ